MAQSLSIPEIRTKKTSYRIIFWTAMLAGTLDIAAAILNSYLRSGTSPIVVLQYIASGVLGNGAFDGGFFTASLGLIFHYFIAFSWTFIFFFVYPKINFSSKYKILVGLAYGVIIWLIMNLIILPLSNAPSIPFQLSQVVLGISFLMLFIGLPISIIYHSYYKN
jgi:hypothetical protein